MLEKYQMENPLVDEGEGVDHWIEEEQSQDELIEKLYVGDRRTAVEAHPAKPHDARKHEDAGSYGGKWQEERPWQVRAPDDGTKGVRHS
jgi:hypothetical protein